MTAPNRAVPKAHAALVSIVTAFALLCTLATLPAHADVPESSSTTAAALDRANEHADVPDLELAQPATNGDDARFATDEGAVELTAGHGDAEIRIGNEAEAATFELPAGVGTQGLEVLPDGTAVLSGEDVDVAVQVSDEGAIRVQKVISGPSAPTRYEYALPLDEGQMARQTADGGVDIYQTFPGESGPGNLVSRVEAPWAVDANGRPVPTHFETAADGSIVQVVEHSPLYAYPVVADPFWIPAIIIGLRVASVVIKVGSRTVRYAAAPASRVVNALRTFQSLSFRTGSHTFRLDKSGIKHVLERHHPNYWNGSTTSTQTFFNPNMSVNDVRALIHAAMKQHQGTLARSGTNARISVSGTANGVRYQMVIDKGRVVQFYPK